MINRTFYLPKAELLLLLLNVPGKKIAFPKSKQRRITSWLRNLRIEPQRRTRVTIFAFNLFLLFSSLGQIGFSRVTIILSFSATHSNFGMKASLHWVSNCTLCKYIWWLKEKWKVTINVNSSTPFPPTLPKLLIVMTHRAEVSLWLLITFAGGSLFELKMVQCDKSLLYAISYFLGSPSTKFKTLKVMLR